jgi:nucleotide-binding universal stress UspA family protein
MSRTILHATAFNNAPGTWEALAKSTIVLGTHGRSGVARMLLGSVAGRVMATARRPVMTVRGR